MAISYTLAHFAKQIPSVAVFTGWILSLNVESYVIGSVPRVFLIQKYYCIFLVHS